MQRGLCSGNYIGKMQMNAVALVVLKTSCAVIFAFMFISMITSQRLFKNLMLSITNKNTK